MGCSLSNVKYTIAIVDTHLYCNQITDGQPKAPAILVYQQVGALLNLHLTS